jgi:tetratricopeptide (TPR) repeat protein
MTDDWVGEIDPSSAGTIEDLARYMRMLRVRADSPAYRVLEKKAVQAGRSLPRTTLGEVLSGRRFPSKSFLLTFVELCGVNPADDRRWESTWTRLAIQYKMDGLPQQGQIAALPDGEAERGEWADQRLQAGEPLVAPGAQETSAAWVAHAATAFQQIENVLAEAGRWDLIEAGLRPIVELDLVVQSRHPDILQAWQGLARAIVKQGRKLETDAGYQSLADRRHRLPGTPGGGEAGTAGIAFAGSRGINDALSTVGVPDYHTRRVGLPPVWNVEPRNPEFTGREPMLTVLRSRLSSGGTAVVQALRGMGGVGKTQIAIEYAYRFSGDYDLVWWVASEDPSLIADQIAALARQLALVEPASDTATATALVKSHLRGNDRWLLVFDNAEEPARLREWLPGGPGHVIITSRAGGWDRFAATLMVDVMPRPEAIDLLCTCHPELTATEADQLAAAVGDLPLALSQAGGFLAETASTAKDYLVLLNEHATELLSEGATGDYPHPLAAAITLSENQLEGSDPLGLAVLRLCSYLAPETVPVDWLIGALQSADILRPPLTGLTREATGALAVRRSVAAITRLGLATSTRDGLRLHRLTQAVTRDQLPEEMQEAVLARSRAILAANSPGDPEHPADWSRWAKMVPHLLAVDSSASTDSTLRDLICGAAWYLIERGDSEASARLATGAIERWTAEQPKDIPHLVWAMRALARAYRYKGRYREARDLYDRALPISRAALGDDDPHTLRLAHGSAINLHLLGENDRARELQSETLARYRRVLGVDHPHALHSANHLGVAHYALGEYAEARRIHEETLDRYRAVVGDDHPDTLRCANNLAVDLRTLQEHDKARILQEDTLTRRKRVLGENHPDTAFSATSLSQTLFMMGELDRAEEFQKWALSRAVQVLGADHPESVVAESNLRDIQDAKRTAGDELPLRRRGGHHRALVVLVRRDSRSILCLPFTPALVRQLPHAPVGSIAWLIYLGACPTAIAFLTWGYALARTSAGKMGTMTYLVPPLAVLLGWVILRETPPALAMAGGALSLAGVAVTGRLARTGRVP